MPARRTPRDDGLGSGASRLFVREQGDGHPLLLINGLGADSRTWEYPEQILARRSRTIVFDSPGTGRSETPLLPRSLPALAGVITGLLDALGHRRVDVLGFSFGGTLAQQLAKDAPDRVRRLALVSTFCGWGATAGEPQALRRLAAHGRTVANPLGYTTSCGPWPHGRACRGCDRSSAPTLVLAGTDDVLVPPTNAVQLARGAPAREPASPPRGRAPPPIQRTGRGREAAGGVLLLRARWNHPRRGRPGCPRPRLLGCCSLSLLFCTLA